MFCLRTAIRLKLILDNAAAKQILLRLGVGRIRHLSCRILWIQQMACERMLETAAIPTKENCADLGTKRLTRERIRYLLFKISVYDTNACELVGTETVRRENQREDFVQCLRHLRMAMDRSSDRQSNTVAKQILRYTLMASVIPSTDALSPITSETETNNFGLCEFQWPTFRPYGCRRCLRRCSIFAWHDYFAIWYFQIYKICICNNVQFPEVVFRHSFGEEMREVCGDEVWKMFSQTGLQTCAEEVKSGEFIRE